METQLGINESYNEDRIKMYHKTCGLNDADKFVPWCSSAMNWCFKQSEYKELCTNSAAAKSWLKVGTPTNEPKLGDLVILTRENGNHVGFYIDSNATHVKLLSGNCDNCVRYKDYAKKRVIGYRRYL